MRPAIGCSSPIRYRSSVLLPLPDPPRMARVVPRSTSKLTCSISTRVPHPIRRSSTTMWGRDEATSELQEGEKHREERADDDHAEDGQHDGGGGARPDRRRSSACGQTLSAGDEPDDEAEERRLDHPAEEVCARDVLRSTEDVGAC